MCLTTPSRVIAVEPGVAVLDGPGEPRVSTLMEPSTRPGDWVLVASGAVVRILDPERAAQIAAAFAVVNPPSAPSREVSTA
jgi:hydrogenase assembly chaperone HypC/HupF